MLCLLFDLQRELLGEVSIHQGVFKHLMLTGAGENEIGALVQVWQTRGVPVRHEIRSSTSEGAQTVVFYKDYIQPRSVKFFEALNRWGFDHGITIIPIEEPLMPLWENLVRLPLAPYERFAFLIALKFTPPKYITEWKKQLIEVEFLIARQSVDVQKTGSYLRKRLSPHLMNPFQKS